MCEGVRDSWRLRFCVAVALAKLDAAAALRLLSVPGAGMHVGFGNPPACMYPALRANTLQHKHCLFQRQCTLQHTAATSTQHTHTTLPSQVFACKAAVTAAEQHLQNLLPQLASTAGVARLQYVSVQNQGNYLLELPAARTEVPRGWEKVGEGEGVRGRAHRVDECADRCACHSVGCVSTSPTLCVPCGCIMQSPLTHVELRPPAVLHCALIQHKMPLVHALPPSFIPPTCKMTPRCVQPRRCVATTQQRSRQAWPLWHVHRSSCRPPVLQHGVSCCATSQLPTTRLSGLQWLQWHS